jgi:hypothetical protein
MVETRFLKFEAKHCGPEEFISYWAKFYDEGKYPDSDYEKNLMRGGKLEKSNIVPLLEWKNGRPLSDKKRRIAQRIIRNLEKFNKFRFMEEVSEKDFRQFWDFTSRIVESGLVWRVYLFHIARPDDYPIIDQHVLRTYHFLTKGEITEPKQLLETYLSYRDFFFELARKSGKRYREVDKALMSFGQYLNSQFCELR